ncbi:hypothetical protein [Nonomuraea basaltis]|uniref:hypothetical protein n=1 Tax=Nonomuraea basaltis TaxID=2495887 RepID=UPI00110C5A3D|nr:hypothetical protein [Nonomuraea basaltis]TMR97446.1 hypothetical protein EJK15_17985 [Nonomuraea basaltis]
MSDEFLFDHSTLSSAGRHFMDSAEAFQRHTDQLLTSVRGTGTTAWGSTGTGAVMDALAELLEQTCGHLGGNMKEFGSAMQRMADNIKQTELDTVGVIKQADPTGGTSQI